MEHNENIVPGTETSESLPCTANFATAPLAPVISTLPGEVMFCTYIFMILVSL